MTTVLVTGAGGVLGQAVVARLRKDPSCRLITAGRSGADLDIDMRGGPDFGRLIADARPDRVLHLAATFSNDFDEAYAVNVEAPRRLLDAALTAPAAPRVLLVGSAAEYGAVRPEENPIREDHALNPVSVYGLSKAWQTQLAGLYAARGADVVVARLFNLDGPGLSERLFVGRIQKQIEEIREGCRTEIEVGPLTAIRDYVHAEEAAQQIIAVAALGRTGSVYHVASGKPVTMRELLRVMLDAAGLGHVTVREAATLSNRSGYDVPSIYADMASTQQLLQQRTHSAAI